MGKDNPASRARFASEAEMIAAIFAPLTGDEEASFGLQDDAALLANRPGVETVLTVDMIVEGVHFLPHGDAADIGWKALAVNISDLVAKGAEPDCYLLSLALSKTCDRAWLERFAEGLREAQKAFGCTLSGGDTVSTPGPLMLSITALGRLPVGTMVHRSGARPGDHVYLTGTIGDAALGLKLSTNPDFSSTIGEKEASYLVDRYLRPQPFAAVAPVIRSHAHAAMDVSDGLGIDFERLCAASGCGGVIELDKVPVSAAAANLLSAKEVTIDDLVTGGDDYCVLATVPPEKSAGFIAEVERAGTKAVRIGEMHEKLGAQFVGADGQAVRLSRSGFDHLSQ